MPYPQMSEFTTKNAAARHRPADDGSQLDVRDMRRLVQALPQYRCEAAARDRVIMPALPQHKSTMERLVCAPTSYGIAPYRN